MDKITADYARWILGTSPHSQTIATLTLCDFKPIKYDIMKQQINYLYTILHRHKDNITNVALEHIKDDPKHPMHEKWLEPLINKIKSWGVPIHDIIKNQINIPRNFTDMHKKREHDKALQRLKTQTKNQIDKEWETERNKTRPNLNRHITQLLYKEITQNNIPKIKGREHNVYRFTSSNIFKEQYGSDKKIQKEKYLKKFATEFTKERLHNRFKLQDTTLNSNIHKTCSIHTIREEDLCCKFCKEHKNEHIIEDEMHIMMDCPLYEKERKFFYDKITNEQNEEGTEFSKHISLCKDEEV